MGSIGPPCRPRPRRSAGRRRFVIVVYDNKGVVIVKTAYPCLLLYPRTARSATPGRAKKSGKGGRRERGARSGRRQRRAGAGDTARGLTGAAGVWYSVGELNSVKKAMKERVGACLPPREPRAGGTGRAGSGRTWLRSRAPTAGLAGIGCDGCARNSAGVSRAVCRAVLHEASAARRPQSRVAPRTAKAVSPLMMVHQGRFFVVFTGRRPEDTAWKANRSLRSGG